MIKDSEAHTASDIVFHFAPAALPTWNVQNITLRNTQTKRNKPFENEYRYLQQTLPCFQDFPCWTVS